MMTLFLSLYHTLLGKQFLLGIMYCESENKKKSDIFYNIFNESLGSGLEELYMFNSESLMAANF